MLFPFSRHIYSMEAKRKAPAEKGLEKNAETPAIPWHPAFAEAIQLELEDYCHELEFFSEYQLNKEPLRIDCIVIKKAKGTIIKKNIAAVFREVNLLEYKSPDDYVSVADFYRLYGYACLYSALENIPITGMSISLIETRHPRSLFAHLQKTRQYKVDEKLPGIYTVKGDILPIQIIESRKLSAEENLWLKYLSNRLDPAAAFQIMNEAAKKKNNARIKAYMNVIIRANILAVKEAIKMTDNIILELNDVFEENGLAALWEARGEERKAFAIAKNLANMGIPIETVVSATQLDPEKIKGLYGFQISNE